MPRKSKSASDDKERGASSTLEAVKHYLQSDSVPDGFSKNDARALRRRAKSFVMIKNDLYFTGGRSRHNKGLLESSKAEAENPENEPDHTQTLRKVIFSVEEQQEAVDKAHVGDDGVHYGMEKTTERVSNQFYWLGITSSVRSTVHSCLCCSARSKNVFLGFKYNASTGFHTVALPPTTTTPAALISVAPAPHLPSRVGHQPGDDDDDCTEGLEVGEAGQYCEEAGGAPPQAVPGWHIKQELEKQVADVFYIPTDVCSHFWQKVEIQVFGPYPAGRKEMYVVVALDSYSQFPDATAMEVLSSSTLTHFILNLFCRYGMMEKLLLLQSKVTKNQDYIISKTALDVGISPALLFPQANPLDERWKRIEKSLGGFVTTYPDFWFYSLEAFMVPLRISLPPEAVYSPYYLLHGREPPMPPVLSGICSLDTVSASCEVQLTEDQERQAVAMVTTAYGVDSHSPAIPQPLPMPPLHTTVTAVDLTLGAKDRGMREMRMASGGKGFGSDWQRLSSVGVKTEEALPPDMDAEVDESAEQFGGDWEEPGYDSDRDAAFEPVSWGDRKDSLGDHTDKRSCSQQKPTRTSNRQRKATLKAQEADLFIVKKEKEQEKPEETTSNPTLSKIAVDAKLKTSLKVSSNKKRKADLSHDKETPPPDTPKQKRGRPRKNTNSASLGVDNQSRAKGWKIIPDQHADVIKNMQQLPLDTFYFIVRQWAERGTFPAGLSEASRQWVRDCGVLEARGGKVYSTVDKSAGRLILTGEKARLGVLRKAHARGEEHYGRKKALKFLAGLNVFWKGMSVDLDAFIHACPECFSCNPTRDLPVVTIPTKSTQPVLGGTQDAHLSEDEEEENSYEDVTQFLTDGTFPLQTSPRQQFLLEERWQSFRLVGGALYRSKGRAQAHDSPTGQAQAHDSPEAQLRQVLISAAERTSVIHTAHIEDGKHLSQQDTQAKLREKYFWSGMTFDVNAHIMGCCMKEGLTAATAVPHRNAVIQARVRKLHKYYIDKTVPKLNTSLIMSDTTSSASDARDEESKAVEVDASASHLSSKQTSAAVVKAVEDIIGDMGRCVAGEDKVKDYSWRHDGKVVTEGQTPVGNLRKDAHKCQHCGQFISGNIAFRVHLYKHTGVKPYSCPCGKSFTTSKSLQVHTRKHTGIKPYLCNQCGREFFRSTSFKYHLKTHSRPKGKPLPCDQCQREFLTQNRLDKHKEHKHPAEPKVFICKHCGKVFTAARSLKWHEQSHTNPRKYQCPICHKDFARRDYVDNHARATHTAQELRQHKIAPNPKQLPPAGGKPPEGKQRLQELEEEEQHPQLVEEDIELLVPQYLQHDGEVVTQQHVQLIQDGDIPTGSNIRVIHWGSQDDDHAHHIPLQHHTHHHLTQPHTITISGASNEHQHSLPSHITISDGHSDHHQVPSTITISGASNDHHHHVPSHITINDGNDDQQHLAAHISVSGADNEHHHQQQHSLPSHITISGGNRDNHHRHHQHHHQAQPSHITISDGNNDHHHLASHITISRADNTNDNHQHQQLVSDLEVYQPALPPPPPPPHRTVHILTRVPQSLPVPSTTTTTTTASHLQSLHALQVGSSGELQVGGQAGEPHHHPLPVSTATTTPLSHSQLQSLHHTLQVTASGELQVRAQDGLHVASSSELQVGARQAGLQVSSSGQLQVASSSGLQVGVHPSELQMVSSGGLQMRIRPGDLQVSSSGELQLGVPGELQVGAPGEQLQVLKQDAVPVQYEVECLSGETSTLTQADLNAVQLLANASLGVGAHTILQ